MQKSIVNKNADIKTPIDNLSITKRKQLQQTPHPKVGGGGARAARRIQIRRPRLASQSGVARRVRPSLGLLQTPKPPADPALSADPTPK